MEAPTNVTLTADEVKKWEAIGDVVARNGIARGHRLGHGFRGDPFKTARDNALGTGAFCKAYNIDSSQAAVQLGGSKVGDNVFIRVAPCKAERPPPNFGNLIIRDDDAPGKRLVLVTGNAPYYLIKGWTTPQEGIRFAERRREANRDEAWFLEGHLNTDMDPLIEDCPRIEPKEPEFQFKSIGPMPTPLGDLVAKYGGYDKIPEEAWAERRRQEKNYVDWRTGRGWIK